MLSSCVLEMINAQKESESSATVTEKTGTPFSSLAGMSSSKYHSFFAFQRPLHDKLILNPIGDF